MRRFTIISGLTMVGLSLISGLYSNDVFAYRYDFRYIPLVPLYVPNTVDSEGNIDFSVARSNLPTTQSGLVFGYSNNITNRPVAGQFKAKTSSTYATFRYNSDTDTCYYYYNSSSTPGTTGLISFISTRSFNSVTSGFEFGSRPQFHQNFSYEAVKAIGNPSYTCLAGGPVAFFSSDVIPPAQNPSLPVRVDSIADSGLLTCGPSNGAVCNGVWDIRNYIRTQILDYRQTYATLPLTYLTADDESEDGFGTASLSLDDFLDTSVPIYNFSGMSIPMISYDDWWAKKENLTKNSVFSYRGEFYFPNGVDLNSELPEDKFFSFTLGGYDTSGSYRVQNSQTGDNTNQCSHVLSEDSKTLSFRCDVLLMYDYAIIPQSVLYIHGEALSVESQSSTTKSLQVWTTSGPFEFRNFRLVTNNDERLPDVGFSSHFNVHAANDYNIPTFDETWEAEQNDDYYSFENLFNFNILNPFSPLFSLFTNSNSCVQIPIISGMLGSEETEYCPWFDSSTRAVLTPVLGIASTMLLFGFFVRWLGSSSGNFFEDTGRHIEIRGKGGKKL